MPRTITLDDLRAAVDGDETAVVFDVLPDEWYASEHIPGSFSAPLEDAGFLDQVAARVRDKGRRIIVYCGHEDCPTAADAAARLTSAGYSQVEVFPGGMRAWSAARLPIATGTTEYGSLSEAYDD